MGRIRGCATVNYPVTFEQKGKKRLLPYSSATVVDNYKKRYEIGGALLLNYHGRLSQEKGKKKGLRFPTTLLDYLKERGLP